MRKNQGITLIALINTIIVMLILGGVVVTVAIQSDLLGTAKTAGDKYKTAYEEESKMSGVTINGKQYGSIEEYMEEINPTIVEGDPKDWDYDVEPDGITLTEYLNEDKTIDTVVIPNYIGGVAVKRIKGNAGNGMGGTTIWNEKICDGITYTGGSTTATKNTTIKKIIISDGIEVIEGGAFVATESLEEVVLPSSILTLGDYSFLCCPNLKKVIIPSNVTNIGRSAFSNCFSLTEVVIPNSVESIGRNAFGSCRGLKKITIPDSVTNIEDFAFSGCDELTEITIPASVTKMGYNVFDSIPSITVHVPWKKGEKPEGWSDTWNETGSNYTITVDYAK